VSLEDRGRSQRRRTAHLPIDVGCLRAAAQNNLATGCCGECGANLEDEHSIRVALGVESKIPRRNLQRRGGFIEARGESLSAQISGYGHRIGCSSNGVVISSGQIQLRLGGSRVSRMDCPVYCAGRESNYGGAWSNAKITRDGGGTRTGYRCAAQDREPSGRSEGYRRLGCRRVM